MPFRDALRARLLNLIKRVVFFANGGQSAAPNFPTYMLVRQEEDTQQTVTLVRVDNHAVLDDILPLFEEEPAFHHWYFFEYQALEQELKKLLASAARQAQSLKKDKDRYALIDKFHDDLGQEVRAYDVVFVLSGPHLDTDQYSVGSAVLRTWTRDQALEWGIREEGLAAVVGPPFLLLRASGPSLQVAIKLGLVEMESSTDLLRIAIGWGGLVYTLNGTTIVGVRVDLPDGGRVREPFLQFAWTRIFAIRPVENPREAEVHRYEEFQPALASLVDPRIAASTQSLLEQLNQVIVLDSEPGFGPEFKRALAWMGSSMTRQRYDNQVIDLCTALECFLASKSDRLKGEQLTLRYAILARAAGNNYGPLNHLYEAYELRSVVVHGSDKDVAGPGHVDILMRAAIFSLLNIFELARNEAGALVLPNGRVTFKALIAYLDGQTQILREINERELRPFSANQEFKSEIRAHFKALSDAASQLIAPQKKVLLPDATQDLAAALLVRADVHELIRLLAESQPSDKAISQPR